MQYATFHQQHQQQQQQPKNPQQIHNNKFNGIWCTSVAILICLLACGITKTNAVPTDSVGGGGGGSVLLRRTMREAGAMASASLVLEEQPKDASSSSTETALEQPQGQCLLDGVLVAETTVFCEKQVGCRAIQKTGHCCPDYKCDCEKDGKTYLNGDKLVDPETPCTVCYCQGGEILCSSVTCFHRDDCTPKYINGRCCPEYDNCPVLKLKPIAPNATLSNTFEQPTSKANPSVRPVLDANTNITIKEITKPIEIRITDDNKGIPIHQMLKPSTTTTTIITPTTEAPSFSASISTTTTTTTTAPASNSTTAATLTTAATHHEVNNESFIASPLSTDNNHLVKTSANVGINNERLKLSASVAYPSTEHSPANNPVNSAGISYEDLDEAVPTKSVEEKSIALFGTQGLQRVDSDAGKDASKVNIKREFMFTTEAPPMSSHDLSSSELIYAEAAAVEPIGSIQQISVEVEPDTAGSDNIYHIILTTDGPRFASTEDAFAAREASSTEGFDPKPSAATFKNENEHKPSVLESQRTTESPNNAQSSMQMTSELITAEESTAKTAEVIRISTENTEASSTQATESNKSSTDGHHLEEEESAVPMEANPAYPSLPEDDFSLRDVNFPLIESEDANEPEPLKDEPRSMGTHNELPKSTKQLDDTMEGSGSSLLADIGAGSSTSEGFNAASSTTELTAALPAKVQIMYSGEDSSAETAISNSTDFQLERVMKEAENETGSGDSLEMPSLESLIGMGSGSGAGEPAADVAGSKKKREREPTTARPTRRPENLLEIDELGSSASAKLEPVEDPKLDVESLKLDEEQEHGAAKSEASNAGDVLSVKTNPAEERAFVDTIVTALATDLDNGSIQRLFLQRFI